MNGAHVSAPIKQFATAGATAAGEASSSSAWSWYVRSAPHFIVYALFPCLVSIGLVLWWLSICLHDHRKRLIRLGQAICKVLPRCWFCIKTGGSRCCSCYAVRRSSLEEPLHPPEARRPSNDTQEGVSGSDENGEPLMSSQESLNMNNMTVVGQSSQRPLLGEPYLAASLEQQQTEAPPTRESPEKQIVPDYLEEACGTCYFCRQNTDCPMLGYTLLQKLKLYWSVCFIWPTLTAVTAGITYTAAYSSLMHSMLPEGALGSESVQKLSRAAIAVPLTLYLLLDWLCALSLLLLLCHRLRDVLVKRMAATVSVRHAIHLVLAQTAFALALLPSISAVYVRELSDTSNIWPFVALSLWLLHALATVLAAITVARVYSKTQWPVPEQTLAVLSASLPNSVPAFEAGCGCACCSPQREFRSSRSRCEERSSIWGQLTFSWVTPLVQLGYARPLTWADLFDDADVCNVDIYARRLMKIWKSQLARNGPRKASLWSVAFQLYAKPLVVYGLCRIIADTCNFAGPLLIGRITSLLERVQQTSRDNPDGNSLATFFLEGLVYLVLFVIANGTTTLFENAYWFGQTKQAITLRAALQAVIFDKALRVNLAVIQEGATCEVMLNEHGRRPVSHLSLHSEDDDDFDDGNAEGVAAFARNLDRGRALTEEDELPPLNAVTSPIVHPAPPSSILRKYHPRLPELRGRPRRHNNPATVAERGAGSTLVPTPSSVSLSSTNQAIGWDTTVMRARSPAGGAAAAVTSALEAATTTENQVEMVTQGKLLNLISLDCDRAYDVWNDLQNIWCSLYIAVACIALLWNRLGLAMVGGVVVMLLTLPLTSYIVHRLKRKQRKVTRLRDGRIKAANEVFSGIRIIKLYAWERSFRDRLQRLREQELKALKNWQKLVLLQWMSWTLIPILVATAAFASYAALGHTLDAATAFTALALFNMLRWPLSLYPRMLSFLADALVAFRRIKDFLNLPEVEQRIHLPDDTDLTLTSCPTIRLRNATLFWPTGTPILANASFECYPGTVTAIVGRTGCGKSGLLAALLGEISAADTESLQVYGRLAYVAQTPWLQSTTVRENITFGRRFKPRWYAKVLHACALFHDLETLPNRDSTEVGEKGVSLSGGQKQRIAIARAVYRSCDEAGPPADIYLLDDCLSAVDSHVARHIFEHAVIRLLRAKKRTVIMVTHKTDILPSVDQVIFMDRSSFEPGISSRDVPAGRIVAVGTHDEISSNEHYTLFTRQETLSGPPRPGGRAPAAGRAPTLDEYSSNSSHVETASSVSVLRRSAISASSEEAPALELECGALLTSHMGSGRTPLRYSTSSIDPARSPSFAPDELLARHVQDMLALQRLYEQRQQAPISPAIEVDCPPAAVPTSASVELLGQQQLRPLTISSTSDSLHTSTTVVHFAAQMAAASRTGSATVQEAVITQGKVGLSTFRAYVRALGGYSVLALLVAMLSLATIAQISTSSWIAYWSDHPDQVPGLPTGVLVYTALGCTQIFFLAWAIWLTAVTGAWASYRLHEALLETVLSAPMYWFETTPMGQILNRFSRDLFSIDQILPNTWRMYLLNLFSVSAVFVVITTTTPTFLALCIPIISLYWYVQSYYIPGATQLRRLDFTSRSPILALFGETLDGAATIRAYDEMERFTQQHRRNVGALSRAVYPNIGLIRWLSVRIESIGSLIVVIAAALAVVRGFAQQISPGTGALAISYAISVTFTLTFMVRTTGDLQTDLVSVERIEEALRNCAQEETEPSWRKISQLPPSIPKSWPTNGAIDFRNVILRYRPNLPLALRGLTLSIQAGEKIGIVGRTGAGKSSILTALLRLVELESGEIRIDGVDIRTVDLHTLRSRFSIIPQDPVLFAGSLRFNLDPLEQHSDAEIWKALEHAHLRAFVTANLAGLHTLIDEGGRNLSQGQRQLVCLARALLRRSNVLLLDEATSAVDPFTDRLVQETICSNFDQCTVLTIAHRISTVLSCNRVLVMDAGQIAEFDSPQALLAIPSIFQQLCVDAGIIPPRPTTATITDSHCRRSSSPTEASAGISSSPPQRTSWGV